MDTHDAQTAPAMLSEERVNEIEADLSAATAKGNLLLMPEIGCEVEARSFQRAAASIPALIASHRAQAQTIAAQAVEIEKKSIVAGEATRMFTEASAERDFWRQKWTEHGNELAGIISERTARAKAAEARAASLGAQVQRAVKVIDAARCIQHWHDAMPDNSGMVVSAEHVRALWQALADYDAALTAPEAPADAAEDPEPADDAPGWTFWNPDAGQEWLPEDMHPVDSGECDDAENVEAMTYGAFLARYCPNLRSRSPEAPAEADTLATLKRFGWAPGNYSAACHSCGQPHHGTDKRSPSCRPCAEQRARAAGLLTNASEGGEQ